MNEILAGLVFSFGSDRSFGGLMGRWRFEVKLCRFLFMDSSGLLIEYRLHRLIFRNEELLLFYRTVGAKIFPWLDVDFTSKLSLPIIGRAFSKGDSFLPF